MGYEPDLILFGSNNGEAPLVHFWRRDNPEWDRLSGDWRVNGDVDVPSASLVSAGFTGFELQDAVIAWRSSPENLRWRNDNAAFLAANPVPPIYDLRAYQRHVDDLRAFRRNWWREVMGK